MFAQVFTLLVALAVSGAAINIDDLPLGVKVEEIFINMRDGTPLHTVIVFPRDAKRSGKKYPIVMDRSPYGYGDLEVLANMFVPFGYISVGQDMRGTALSQGNFSMFISDKYDSEDAGNWLVQQEWSDGRIFTFGASADGIGSFQTVFTNPSWLAGQYIAWSPANLYNILFPYGTYKQETTENWLLGITMPDPDVVYTNIATVHANEGNQGFWDQVGLEESTFANVHYPNAFWGGWYDLFSTETLNAYHGYNFLSDPSVRYTSSITMDPLGHCLQGAAYFPQNAVEGRTGVVFVQAFQVMGIASVRRPNFKNVTFYVMSSNDTQGLKFGQYWSSLEQWPEPTMTDFYLHADGSASLLPASPTDMETTSYIYDPSNPQPTNGGNNLPPDIGGDIPCGPLDQGEIDQRSDVITFQTSPLDIPLPLTGPMFATLFVSSSAVDTDFMVRISDVYPTGEVRLLMDNAVRMRWRNGPGAPQLIVPGTVYEVNMNIWNTSYVVAPGHSLRFSISSSNNPRFSVNPNNGLLLADPAYPGQNISATNVIYHSLRYPSRVTLPVVRFEQIPPMNVLQEAKELYPLVINDETIPKLTTLLNKLGRNNKK